MRGDIEATWAYLDQLQTEALAAYEAGDWARAEELDAEYAELAEQLEDQEAYPAADTDAEPDSDEVGEPHTELQAGILAAWLSWQNPGRGPYFFDSWDDLMQAVRSLLSDYGQEAYGQTLPAHITDEQVTEAIMDAVQDVTLRRTRRSAGSSAGTRVVYHGSRERDLEGEHLAYNDPTYEGGIGGGIYVAFDRDVAEFYAHGGVVYEADLLISDDQILWLTPDEMSQPETGLNSVLMGERVYPFTFHIGETRYTVGDDWLLNSESLIRFKRLVDSLDLPDELKSYLAALDEMPDIKWDFEDILDRVGLLEVWEEAGYAIDDPSVLAQLMGPMQAQLKSAEAQAEAQAEADLGLLIDLNDIGAEAAAAGYRAVYLEGVRGSHPDSELLVFSPEDIGPLRLAGQAGQEHSAQLENEGVGLMVVDRDGHVLLVEHHNGWELPGGFLTDADRQSDAPVRAAAMRAGLEALGSDDVSGTSLGTTRIDTGGHSYAIMTIVAESRPHHEVGSWHSLSSLPEDIHPVLQRYLEAHPDGLRSTVYDIVARMAGAPIREVYAQVMQETGLSGQGAHDAVARLCKAGLCRAEMYRQASEKKVQFLKKQHPNSARLIDWLAANDPTAPKYTALPDMWEELKKRRPEDVIKYTKLFFHTQPYIGYFNTLFERAKKSSSLREFFSANSMPNPYGGSEKESREHVLRAVPAIRSAKAIGKGFTDPALGGYVSRELIRAIASAYDDESDWSASPASVEALLKSVPIGPDPEENQDSFRRAIDLIRAGQEAIIFDKPKTIQELEALLAPKVADGTRPEGAVDHGNGVTEYLNHNAARVECGEETDWCWAYATPDFWKSYFDGNRIFRVDDYLLPNSPYGTIVSRSSKEMGETRDKNDKTASDSARKKIESVLIDLGLAEEPKGVNSVQQEIERWSEYGLDWTQFNSEWNPDKYSLDHVLEYINHGFTPDQARLWLDMEDTGLPGIPVELAAKWKDNPLFLKMHPRSVYYNSTSQLDDIKKLQSADSALEHDQTSTFIDFMDRVTSNEDPLSPDEAMTLGTTLASLSHQPTRSDNLLALTSVPRRGVPPRSDQGVQDILNEAYALFEQNRAPLTEAYTKGYLPQLISGYVLKGRGVNGFIENTVAELRDHPFPREYFLPSPDPKPEMVKFFESHGVPRNLAVEWTRHIEADRLWDPKDDDVMRERKLTRAKSWYEPIIQAMKDVGIWVPTVPGTLPLPDLHRLNAVTKAIQERPQEVKQAIKADIWPSVAQNPELALAWLPYVQQRWVVPRQAYNYISRGQHPDSVGEMLFATRHEDPDELHVARQWLSPASARMYDQIGITDLNEMIRLAKEGLQPGLISAFFEEGVSLDELLRIQNTLSRLGRKSLKKGEWTVRNVPAILTEVYIIDNLPLWQSLEKETRQLENTVQEKLEDLFYADRGYWEHYENLWENLKSRVATFIQHATGTGDIYGVPYAAVWAKSPVGEKPNLNDLMPAVNWVRGFVPDAFPMLKFGFIHVASEKKVEFMKKQFPASARLIDWLAARDPTRPKHTALPVMWNALKVRSPMEVVELTQTYLASQPYIEFYNSADVGVPATPTLEAYLKENSYLEREWRSAVAKRLPALRAARGISAIFEDPDLGSYAQRELTRAITNAAAWGLSGKEVARLLKTVPLGPDAQDNKTRIINAIELITHSRNIVRKHKPASIDELDALTRPKFEGQRPEGAIDHGNGVTEYLNHKAARAECGGKTKWCWAYATTQYWNSYFANNRIFRVDDPALPNGPYGTVVSRYSKQIGETRDRNDNQASKQALKAIEAKLIALGLAVPKPEGVQDADEAQRWAEHGLDWAAYHPDPWKRMLLHTAIDFANHGISVEDTIKWHNIYNLLSAADRTYLLEAIPRMREIAIPSSLERLRDSVHRNHQTSRVPKQIINTLRALLGEEVVFDSPVSPSVERWPEEDRRATAVWQGTLTAKQADLVAEALDTLRGNTHVPPITYLLNFVVAHEKALEEAHSLGILDMIIKHVFRHWHEAKSPSDNTAGKQTVESLVEQVRNDAFPRLTLHDMSYGSTGRHPINEYVDQWVREGVPKGLAKDWAGHLEQNQYRAADMVDTYRPIVEAMKNTGAWLPWLPVPYRYPTPHQEAEIKEFAQAIYDNPDGVRLVNKAKLIANTETQLTRAIRWAPFVLNRWSTHELAQASIKYGLYPEASADMLLAFRDVDDKVLRKQQLHHRVMEEFEQIGVTSVEDMLRFLEAPSVNPELLASLHDAGLSDVEVMQLKDLFGGAGDLSTYSARYLADKLRLWQQMPPREASEKKVEFLKKQHPASARLISWLAERDPTAPRYTALPAMWNAVKVHEPADVAAWTQDYLASQPYIEFYAPPDSRSKPKKSLEEYLTSKSATSENTWRKNIRERLYALRTAESMTSLVANADLNRYAQRELLRAIANAEEWTLADLSAVPQIMQSVQLSGDTADDQTRIRRAINLIVRGQELITEHNLTSVDALNDLLYPTRDSRTEGAIDHGNGITEYLTYEAARDTCSQETKWCWAYTTTNRYWNSYSAKNRIFRIDDETLPRSPYGTVVSRETGKVGETRDRNDNEVAPSVLAKIEETLVARGLAKPGGTAGVDVAAGGIIATWEEAGLDWYEFYPQGNADSAFPPPHLYMSLDTALNFVNHGFTPQEAVAWYPLVWRVRHRSDIPEVIAPVKDLPIFKSRLDVQHLTRNIPNTQDVIDVVEALQGNSIGSYHEPWEGQLSEQQAELVLLIRLVRNVPLGSLTTAIEFVQKHEDALVEAQSRKFLTELMLYLFKGWPKTRNVTESPEAAVARVRNDPYPESSIDSSGSTGNYLNRIVSALEQQGLPSGLAHAWAHRCKSVKSQSQMDKILAEAKPLVEAMLDTGVLLNQIPQYDGSALSDRVDFAGVATALHENPEGMQQANKVGLISWDEKSARAAAAFGPFVAGRWIPLHLAQSLIRWGRMPEDHAPLLPAFRDIGNQGERHNQLSEGQARAYESLGVHDVNIMEELLDGTQGFTVAPNALKVLFQVGLTLDEIKVVRKIQVPWPHSTTVDPVRASTWWSLAASPIESVQLDAAKKIKDTFDLVTSTDARHLDAQNEARQAAIEDPAALIFDTIAAMAGTVTDAGGLAWTPSPLTPDGRMEHVVIRPEDRLQWLRDAGLVGRDLEEIAQALESPEGLNALAQGFQVAGVAETFDVQPSDGSIVLYRAPMNPTPRLAQKAVV